MIKSTKKQWVIVKLVTAFTVCLTGIVGVPASAIACSTTPLIPEFGCGNTGASAYAIGTSSTNTFYGASMAEYSGGWGVSYQNESTGSPQHALDNDGKTELIAISFATPVSLSEVTLGWVGGTPVDADFSVLALQPGKSSTIAGKTLSQLMSAWILVGNYSNSSTGTVSVNSGDVSSSWWIISAYNANYGGAQLDSRFDYMKILSVACSEPNKVSEPGSLLLLGGGLIGLMALRRRRQV